MSEEYITAMWNNYVYAVPGEVFWTDAKANGQELWTSHSKNLSKN